MTASVSNRRYARAFRADDVDSIAAMNGTVWIAFRRPCGDETSEGSRIYLLHGRFEAATWGSLKRLPHSPIGSGTVVLAADTRHNLLHAIYAVLAPNDPAVKPDFATSSKRAAVHGPNRRG